MKHHLLATVLAVSLMACITKPIYNVEVNVAEGGSLTNEITVDKPMDIRPATQLDLDLLPSI
jgi:predicted RNA-binding protein with PUA domain